MRVLHCLSQRLGRTGSGVYLHELRSRLPGDNAVLAVDPEADFPVELPFGQVGMSDVMPYPSRTFASLAPTEVEVYESALRQALQQAIARFRPDVVHCHHLWILAGLACRLHPRVVVSCHGTCLRQHEQVPGLSRRVDLSRAAALFALHEPQRQEILRRFPDCVVHVVGSGFCQRRFQPPREREPGPPRCLFVGKLSRAKGVPWLLEAAEGLDLTLVGGGDPELLERAGPRAVGLLSPEQLVRAFQRADVFVLPSLSEGLPLVVLEALGAGCRVVVSDLPGLPDMPREWLLKVGLPLDTAELRAALLEQMGHPRSLRPAPGIEQQSWEALAGRIARHYREVCPD